MADGLVLAGSRPGSALFSPMDCNIVAGHAGARCDPTGEIFIKPCVQTEGDFYTIVNQTHPALADIFPEFMGTLTLNETTVINSINVQLPRIADRISVLLKNQVIELAFQLSSLNFKPPSHEKVTTGPYIDTNQAIVQENLAYGFKRPNIMDVKIGVRLWADDASPEKKARRKRTAEETTHKDLNFGIGGMRVYRGPGADGDRNNFKEFDRKWGRDKVTKDNVVESFREFIFNPAAGIDDNLGKMVAQGIINDLIHIESVLKEVETRIYSGNVLIVFEGDGHVLKTRINELSSKPDPDMPSSPPPHDQQDQVSEDGSDSTQPPPRLWTVKLIDFAHAQLVPGQGPDKNFLFGLQHLRDTLSKLAD